MRRKEQRHSVPFKQPQFICLFFCLSNTNRLTMSNVHFSPSLCDIINKMQWVCWYILVTNTNGQTDKSIINRVKKLEEGKLIMTKCNDVHFLTSWLLF